MPPVSQPEYTTVSLNVIKKSHTLSYGLHPQLVHTSHFLSNSEFLAQDALVITSTFCSVLKPLVTCVTLMTMALTMSHWGTYWICDVRTSSSFHLISIYSYMSGEGVLVAS